MLQAHAYEEAIEKLNQQYAGSETGAHCSSVVFHQVGPRDMMKHCHWTGKRAKRKAKKRNELISQKCYYAEDKPSVILHQVRTAREPPTRRDVAA